MRRASRYGLLPIATLVPLAQGGSQPPACSLASVGLLEARCTLQAPGGSQWSPAHAYHTAAALAAREGKDEAFRDFRRVNESCHTVVSVLGEGSSRELASRSFRRVAVADAAGSWANTPDGEWTASVNPNATGVPPEGLLQLGSGRCALAGISVYRPAADHIALRLDFDGCDAAAGVRHAAVTVGVQRAEAGSSQLAEWMCALMDHEVCWPQFTSTSTTTTTTTTRTSTPPPGHISVNLHAEYVAVGAGAGRCQNQKVDPPVQHALATTMRECAQECITENTVALHGDSGSQCAGFAFSEFEPPHCLLYKRLQAPSQAQQQVASDTWRCFAMGPVTGGHIHKVVAPATATTEAPPSRPPVPAPAPPPDVALDLQAELGWEPRPAVRRRLAPLTAWCYEPFEWIALDPASKVTLNGSAWDLLEQHLPVIAPPFASMDSLVAVDEVCVRLDMGSSSAAGKAAGTACMPPPTIYTHDWWMLLLAALFAADAAMALTFYTLNKLRQEAGAEWPAYAALGEAKMVVAEPMDPGGAAYGFGADAGRWREPQEDAMEGPSARPWQEAHELDRGGARRGLGADSDARPWQEQSPPRRPGYSGPLNSALVPAGADLAARGSLEQQ